MYEKSGFVMYDFVLDWDRNGLLLNTENMAGFTLQTNRSRPDTN